MIIASIDGNIENHTIELDSNYAVTVVLSAKGYPEKYNKGMKIKGLNNVQDKIVFHAGTKLENNDFLTNGGRVLNVVGIDENLKQSIFKAYELANIIDFKDKYFRSDIGMKAFKYLEEKE